MTYTIVKLSRKSVETQDGPKEKYGVQFKEKPNIWLDAWIGKWNADWQVGTQIDIEKDQIKSREYNGKTYYSIKAPESAQGFRLPEWVGIAIKDLQNRVAALEAAGLEAPEEAGEIFEDDGIPF